MDTDCQIETGTYRAALPDGAPTGAIIFLHGWQGNADGLIHSTAFVDRVLALGVALIVPQGKDRVWNAAGSPFNGRDDIAFVDTVRRDAIARFDLPADRIMVAGFSIGGSMVWDLACHRGADYAGFASISGSFWMPHPKACPGPLPILLHIHGKRDNVVPIEGLTIRQWTHGSMQDGFAFWRVQAGCEDAVPQTSIDDPLTCTQWPACESAGLQLCLHPDGHALRSLWLTRSWRELSRLKGWN